MHMGIRQGITNSYLFAILRYLFLGNLLLLVPEILEGPLAITGLLWEVWVVVLVVSKGGALVCFFLGLGRILRYLRLRSTDGDLVEEVDD